MIATSVLLSLALAAPPAADTTGDPHIADCVITSIGDQFVPATDAGILMQLNVYEGMPVTKGMEIGQIDTTEALANLEIKKAELAIAKQAAASNIDKQHAEAAYYVAYYKLERLKEANKKAPGTVSNIEIKETEFEKTKAMLAIKQTEEKHAEAELTAKARETEVDAATKMLKRLSLTAPFDGVVVGIEKQEQEWVAAGEPVVQVVDIKRLRVKGNLEASEWGPEDIANRRVTVEVSLPRGRTISVPGKVTYVSPVVTLDHLPVWAEIESPIENGLPVVRAGLPASMTVHVSQPVAVDRRAAPFRNTSERNSK